MITTVTAVDSESPVSLDEAKAHCRVMNGDHDVYIQSLIGAATEYCETCTGRSLRVSQTLQQKFRSWPCCKVQFNRQPVLENVPGVDPVEAATVVQYYDADDVLQTVDAANYRLQLSTHAASYLELDGDFTRPTIADRDDAVIVTYLAGYGSVEAVPARAKHAIKLLIGHWYEHGEAVNIGNITTEIPMGVDALIGSLDWGCYR